MRKKDSQPVTVAQLENVLDKRFEQFGRQITENITGRITQQVTQQVTQQTTHVVSQLIEYIDVRVGAVEKIQMEMKNTLDWLVGAYKKFEEEHMVLTSKYSSVQHRLDDHEERLVVLEK